jgi:hypothetical protein
MRKHEVKFRTSLPFACASSIIRSGNRIEKVDFAGFGKKGNMDTFSPPLEPSNPIDGTFEGALIVFKRVAGPDSGI